LICERFIYGLFNNAGYKAVYSPQAKKLLTKESLEKLQNLHLRKKRLTDIMTMQFPSEGVVTRSYLHATRDRYGREGIINHTVILKVSEFFQEFPEVLETAFSLIKEPLMLNLSRPPESLEPLEVKR